MKKNVLFFISIFAAVFLVFTSCGKKAVDESSIVLEQTSETKEIIQVPKVSVKYEKPKFDILAIDIDFPSSRTLAKAHEKHLQDALLFQELPDWGIPTGKTAVVGSRTCTFYPVESVSKIEDVETLVPGTSLPFGSIISIGERCSDIRSDREGMFKFQEHWNYFYKTEWEGQRGIVFGADLYGLGDSNEDNRISSMLYLSQGRPDMFYPISGYSYLDSDIAKMLETHRLLIQRVDPSEYSLYAEKPDDMISLYDALYRKKFQPIFVTTDLAAHASHLVFDRILQHIEEEYFYPRLLLLCQNFIKDLEARQAVGEAELIAKEKALLFFKTAEALLLLAPEKKRVKDDYGRIEPEPSYVDVDRDLVLASFPDEVGAEIALMEEAGGFAESNILSFEKDGEKITYLEDFSQYKARGHYTKNGVLAAYFKAMMWFGRSHFLLAADDAGVYPIGGLQSSNAEELTFLLAPVALLINDIVLNNKNLYTEWKNLFDPVTQLIGMSDELGIDEVMPLWESLKGSDFNVFISDKKNIVDFMKEAHNQLEAPAIAGSSVFYGPSEGEDRKPPIGWRLFGQRFTLDSFVHNNISSPRLQDRTLVTGLDIMNAFGSKTAEYFLEAEFNHPVYGEGLKKTLSDFEKMFDEQDESFWNRSYYNAVLYTIKNLANFEQGAGFYFTESPAWNIKALNAAHGAWAELRHDTILYAKQSYAEKGGNGDYDPTYRTEPIPNPVHYLEPNTAFWKSSALSIVKLYNSLAHFDLLDAEGKRALSKLLEMYEKAIEISKLETEDKPVPEKDLAFIKNFSKELINIVLVYVRGENIANPDDLKMACVADIFTDAESGTVLEVAVGNPRRLFVPLNDTQGGKRIAIGYTYSYYEFTQPITNRLNDDEWKKMVYEKNATVENLLPFWAKESVFEEKSQ